MSRVCLQEDIEAELFEKLNDLLMIALSLVSDCDLMKDVVNTCMLSGRCYTDSDSPCAASLQDHHPPRPVA